MRGERKLYNFEEKRLAKLLRQAALAHIRRAYRPTEEALAEILAQLEWAGRIEWADAEEFVERWLEFVKNEREGEPLYVAPAAWIHLAQELALELERGGGWIQYLQSRWMVERSRLSPLRRFYYGALGLGALGLSMLIIVLVVREVASGRLDSVFEFSLRADREGVLALLLTVARVAGTFLMVEHGFQWLRRALSGEGSGTEVVFLGSGNDGLTLVE